MQDQPVFGISVETLDGASNSNLYYDIANLEEAEAEYFGNNSGRLTSPTGITNAFHQLNQEDFQSLNITGHTSQNNPNQSQVEYIYTALFYPFTPSQYFTPSTKDNYFTVGASLVAATSRGTVSLASSFAGDPPVINPNVSTKKHVSFLTHPT